MSQEDPFRRFRVGKRSWEESEPGEGSEKIPGSWDKIHDLIRDRASDNILDIEDKVQDDEVMAELTRDAQKTPKHSRRANLMIEPQAKNADKRQRLLNELANRPIKQEN